MTNFDDPEDKDLFDVALEQAIREGRVVVSFDDEGRKVFRVVVN